MKCELTLQEKLKDLRTERGLRLEELARETGLSKSALGSYESNDYKDIPYRVIIELANYYGVSVEYLMGVTDNKTQAKTSVRELKLDDETVEILKSGKINNRLLCEIIKHPDFWKFMSDTEIYIDSLASMQINNLNSYIAMMRTKIQLKDEVPETEHYVRTLKASEIEEDDYFSRLIGTDITNIAKDIRENHKKDKETGEDNNPLTEVIDIVQEYATATDPMKATLSTLSRQLGMSFNKMDPAEIQFFTGIVEKYSNVYKGMLPKKGRGKR